MKGFFAVVLLLPHLAIASILRTGRCDQSVRGMAGFSKAAYLGHWYEWANVFEWYQDLPFGGRCVRATYTDEGDRVGVLNEYVSKVTGYGNIRGNARFANPSDPQMRGELIVGFGSFRRKRQSAQIQSELLFLSQPGQTPAQDRIFSGGSSRPNYSVVRTDYTSYAVVYNCSPLAGFLRKESLWLLTRDQLPSAATVAKGLAVMKQYRLPYKNLVKTQQTGCSLLPGSST